MPGPPEGEPNRPSDRLLAGVHSPFAPGSRVDLGVGNLRVGNGLGLGLWVGVGAGAGDVEEDAGAEDQQQQRPDPVQAQRLVGAAQQEQQTEAGEGEPEGQRDGVELVAAHHGASGGAMVAGAPARWSNGPTSSKDRGSLARRTSITP